MPAAISVSTSGRRKSRFGTGRVTSQMRMQALRFPRAKSLSCAAPVGRASTSAIAFAGSAIGCRGSLRMTTSAQPGGACTVIRPLP